MIITDEKQLRQKCEDVSVFEAHSIISQLEEHLDTARGIGLAANQIGINKRVLIIRVRGKELNLANPEIVDQYDLSEFHQEGCLSFPEQWIRTKRYAEVVIRDMFHPAGVVLAGLEAVVAQHEIGHTLGKTMYDYEIPTLRPNDKCWCGYGKKYKKCHMGKVIKS